MGVGAGLIALIWAVRGSKLFLASIFDRRSARQGRELQVMYQGGLEILLTGRPERALGVMNEILSKDEDHSGALMTGADILRSLARSAEAVEWRQRVLASAPDDISALSALAEDHRVAGDRPRAAATLERLLELRPKEALGVAERLREVLIESGQYEKALSVHDRLVKLRGDSRNGEEDLERAGLETRLAMQVAESGRPRDAVAMLKKVLKRHPRFVPAILDLARSHTLEGDEDAAIEAWIDGFERTNEAIVLVEAEEYFLESRHEGDAIERAEIALRTFKRLVACSGSRPLAVAFLGKLYTRHEMLDDAAAAFESVRERFPEDPTFAYYSARIAEKQGRPEVAARLYRSIIKALDVLSLRFRCRNCGWRTAEYEDRCAGCRRWGIGTLDVGADDDALHGRRPLYAVPTDDAGHVERDALA
jgi:lipopolysaccharide biosynthesis regulator YciM